MRFNSKLLVLFSIFCLIASAGAVSAADLSSQSSVALGDGIEYALENLEPGAGLPLENQTSDVPMNVTGNMTHNVTGNATCNASGNATANVNANQTHNATTIEAPTALLSTGNPIMVLIIMIAAVGGYGILRRKI